MLLPRPISISEAENGNVTVIYKVVGRGTKYLSEYRENQEIRLSSPLGKGYRMEDDYAGKKVALVAGGIGISPMIGLTKELKDRNAKLNIFLGFQSQTFLIDKLEKLCENIFIATNDGSRGFFGNAVEMLKRSGSIYDEYFACGPKEMLKVLSEYTCHIERNVQVSIEERMGCGYGACVGCACKIREDGAVSRKSVCKDGPVFLGKDVIWDE
jgi:dihydroorotate dehydrogenase electron transfer subunit